MSYNDNTSAIKIFVAGPLASIKRRSETLCEVEHRLSFECKKSCNRYIRIKTCEDFSKDNQDEYNDYIVNEAGLVLFIIDSRLQQKSEQELFLALDSYQKGHHPVVKLLVNKDTLSDDDKKYYEGILHVTNKDYYTEFSECSENVFEGFKSVFEKKIRDFVHDYEEKDNSRWFSSLMNKWKSLILMCTLFVVGIVVGHYAIDKNDRPMRRQTEQALIIAGGGSAANFISKYYPQVMLDSTTLRYYMHMPSKHAWRLLEEEVMSTVSPDSSRYLPICISAESATEKNFLSGVSASKFVQRGSVVSYHLGYDTLVVYVHKENKFPYELLSSKELNTRTIHVSTLAHLINKDDALNIFTTSVGSGTRDTYEKALEGLCDLNAHLTINFQQDSDLPHININSKASILLGSQCYSLKALENPGKFVVIDDSGKPILKDIYLFCMAYTGDVNHPNRLTIPVPTTKFLKELDLIDKDAKTPISIERDSVNQVMIYR